MTTKLTDKSVAAAKPTGARCEMPDGLIGGLYLVVQPSGSKSWAVRYRHDGRPRKLTLGAYPAIGLAAARKLARESLVSAAGGGDPATEKHSRREAADLWENVVELFLERYAKVKCRPRTVRDYDELFRLYVTPRWRGRKLQSIGRRDVVDLLDRLQTQGLTIRVNRTLAAIRKLFAWAMERSIVTASPAAGISAPVLEAPRDRVLSDKELAAVWKATLRIASPNREFVQLMILTGQRMSECAGLRHSEIERAEWVLPAERTKNGRQHVVPLAQAAVEVIHRAPNVDSEFVFTTTGRTPISGFSRLKEQLDRHVAEFLPGADVPRWTFHDLRRTFATGCAALGVSLPVIERCLNHVSGSFGGIVGVYQRHSFAEDKRFAMDTWAAHVAGLTP